MKTIYIVTFRVTHWILEMIVSHFSMQEEDILEHINVKCHLCILLLKL